MNYPRRKTIRQLYRMFLFIGFFLLKTAPVSATGSFAGNGGADDLQSQWSSAWFLGERTILWCIVYDKDFGRSRSDALFDIKNAFAKWRSYMYGKGLFDLQTPFGPPSLLNNYYQTACDDKTDLTFYLGASTDAVKDGIALYANPIAFSRATDYNKNENFGKGYVWLRKGRISNGKTRTADPDWSFRPNFVSVITHELGHILGCRHIEGTIMTANIADIVLNPRFPSKVDLHIDPFIDHLENRSSVLTAKELKDYDASRTEFLSYIDSFRELWFHPSSGISLYQFVTFKNPKDFSPDLLDRSNAGYDQVEVKSTFAALTGHKPNKAPAHAILTDGIFSQFSQFRGNLPNGKIGAVFSTMDFATYYEAARELHFDHPDAWTFLIEFEQPKIRDISALSDEIIFKRFFDDKTLPLYHSTVTYRGHIVKKVNGKVSNQMTDVDIPVILRRNFARFQSMNHWDSSLATLSMVAKDGTESLIFRGIFGQQGFWGNSFYAKPGGAPAPQWFISELNP